MYVQIYSLRIYVQVMYVQMYNSDIYVHPYSCIFSTTVLQRAYNSKTPAVGLFLIALLTVMLLSDDVT
jgi:hypothetical protein